MKGSGNTAERSRKGDSDLAAEAPTTTPAAVSVVLPTCQEDADPVSIADVSIADVSIADTPAPLKMGGYAGMRVCECVCVCVVCV